MPPPFLQGLAAAVWFGLLLLSSGAGGAGTTVADRLRRVLIAGTVIPFVLALLGLLNGPCAWATLSAYALVRRLRDARRGAPSVRPGSRRAWLLAGLPALLVLGLAWPAAVRPPDEGDTLWYHLPNAATWVGAGGLWQATSRYWWFPGGSELFAAGLIAAAGPIAAGLSGTAAMLLVALRTQTWLRAEGVPTATASALTAALLASSVFAKQAADLQNDVWLAAAFLEALWCGRQLLRSRPGPQGARTTLGAASGLGTALAGACALCALIKPYGFVYALVALVLARANPRVWLGALLPLGLWALRDAWLWNGAADPAVEGFVPNTLSTTIAGNLATAVPALLQGLTHAGPGTAVLLVAACAVAIFGRDAAPRIATAAGLLFFLFEPFGFRTGPAAQLALGDSLRYADPAFATALIGLAPFARRFPLPALTLGTLLAALGLSVVLAEFWFVEAARWVLPLLALGLLPALFARTVMRERLATIFALCVAGVSVAVAARDPVAFYDARLDRSGGSTLFAELRSYPRPVLVVTGMDSGPFDVILPHTRIVESGFHDLCATARRAHALIVNGGGAEDSSSGLHVSYADAPKCGPVVKRFTRGVDIIDPEPSAASR